MFRKIKDLIIILKKYNIGLKTSRRNSKILKNEMNRYKKAEKLKKKRKREIKWFFNYKMNEKWEELKYTFDGMKSKMKQNHDKELKKFEEDFEKKYNINNLKDSKEFSSKKNLKF